MLKSAHTLEYTEAGTDEAGRGCLAGPVVAAAVILPKDFSDPLLKDSKLLKAREREDLKQIICEKAHCWAIAEASAEEIDQLNILKASMLAMHRALEKLPLLPELILVDGNHFPPYGYIPHRCFVKGDNMYASIAAASVLAKTYRDELMTRLSLEFPEYDWENNAGYGTPKHLEAIRQWGLTPWHRKTFKSKKLVY